MRSKTTTYTLIIGHLLYLIMPEALASWGVLDTALDRVLSLLTGTPAKILAGIVVVIVGYKFLFSDAPPHAIYLIGLLIGLCAVFGGRQLVSYLGFI
jgi:type IV secretory pathway VirB2 component (pilin)